MALGPLVVGVNADASGFASSAAQAIAQSEPQMKVAGLTSGVAIGTALGNGITSAISGAFDLVKGAISGFAELVHGGLDLSSELMATQLQTGVAATSLLALKEAAASTGTSFDSLVDGIRETNLKLGEALNGEASAVQAFQNIGLSVEQLRGMAPDQLFALVTDKLRGMEDGAMRVAAAAKIMGDDVGVKMPQYLAQGGQAAAQLAQRWIDLGAVIEESDIAASSGAATRIGLVEETFDRFKILLASRVTPFIEYAITLIDDLVKETGGLGPTATKAADGFGVIAGYAIDAGQVIYGVGKVVQGLGKGIVAMGAIGVLNFSMIGGAAGWAVGKMVSGFAGGFADIIQGVRETGDSIRNFFYGLTEMVGNVMIDAFNLIITAWNNVASIIHAPTASTIGHYTVSDRANSQAGEIEKAARELQKWGADLATSSTDLMQVAMGQYGDVFAQFGEAGTTIMEGASNIAGVFGMDGAATKWSDTFKKGVSDAADKIAKESANAAATTANAARNGNSAMQAYSPYSNQGNNYSNWSGITTPSSVANSIMPNSSYGPPINSTINVASGVDAQQVKQAVKEAEKRVINTIQTKNAAGGTFRNNLKC